VTILIVAGHDETFRQNDKSFSPRARLLKDPERQVFARYFRKLLPSISLVFVQIILSLISAVDRED